METQSRRAQFMPKPSILNPNKAVASLSSPLQSCHRERDTPQRSSLNVRRPPSAWHRTQHSFISTGERERRQIFVGTRFRNLGEYSGTQPNVVNPERKRNSRRWAGVPGWSNCTTYTHVCESLYILTCVYVCVFIFFHNL